MDPISTGLSLGGSLLGGVNKARAARKQNRETRKGIATQQNIQTQADYALNELLDGRATSAPDIAGERGNFMSQLRANSAPQDSSLPIGSAAYRAGTAKANTGAQNYGGQLADLFARIQAPGRQRQNEAIQNSRLNDDFAGLARKSSGERFLTNMRVNSITPNPWVDMAAGLAKNAGQMVAGRKLPGGGISSDAALEMSLKPF
jgi:hypothetical protein